MNKEEKILDLLENLAIDVRDVKGTLVRLEKTINKVDQNQVVIENKLDNRLKAHDDELDIVKKDIETLKQKIS